MLVVEDEPLVAVVTQRSLEKLGGVVEVAYNGEEGLALALSGRFALLVLDWRLPRMSGGGVLHRLRGVGVMSRVMVVSGYPEEEAAALAAGADVFVQKPWRHETMGAIVARLLARPADDRVHAPFHPWTILTLALIDRVAATLRSDTAVLDAAGRQHVLHRLGRALGDVTATVTEFSAGAAGFKVIGLAPLVTRATIAHARRLVAVPPLDLTNQHAAVVAALEYVEAAPRNAHPLHIGIVARRLNVNPRYLATLVKSATGRGWSYWRTVAHVRESVRALIAGTRWIERSATKDWGWSSRQRLHDKMQALLGVGASDFRAIVREPASEV